MVQSPDSAGRGPGRVRVTGIGLALPGLWRSRGLAVHLLLPLSWLYRGLARARRACYARGPCRVQGFSSPVVVVGGITVGGSGKTPLVMHVARLLATQGCKPGIVSRGYGGRPGRMPLFVDAGTPASQCGDEPAMLARNLDVPVVVDRDRPRGVRTLIEQTGCGVVISDDGLQHYAMDRQVEIVALGGEGSRGNGYCLPAGPLREPLTRLDDVDMVVSSSPAPHPGWFAASLRIESLQRLNGAEQRPLDAFRGRRVHAAAGIGNPGGFFTMLAEAGIDVQPHPFPDHHRFGAEDFSAMRDAPIVMTEKDAVKCEGLSLEDAWYTRASIELDARFDNTLIELLKI